MALQDIEKSRSRALPIIRKFEGFRANAYQDSAGVWTIGYGTTGGVHPGQTITEAEAQERLKSWIDSFAIPALEGTEAKITPDQGAALISFIYNLGPGAYRSSTLRQKLESGDIQGAADEFLRWTKAGGVELAGLVRRRQAERELFLGIARKKK